MSTYPHRIRLRGPWQHEVAGAGIVRARRRFGYPGRIDSFERVWLTFAGVRGKADVLLNQQHLGTGDGESFAFDVTSLLRERNELVVEIDAGAGEAWGEVALEVRCTAYLRNVRIWFSRDAEGLRLEATGEVVGFCAGPLELYLICDRFTAAYAVAEAAAEGNPFHLVALDPMMSADAEEHVVRVELVNAAAVWYEFEQSLKLPN